MNNNCLHSHCIPHIRPFVPKINVSRYDSLNKEGKTINLFQEFAAKPTTPIRWVVGHGLLNQKFPKVPANTFIVFMAEPGYPIAKTILLGMNKAFTNTGYLRNVFSGKEKNIKPTRLGYWKEHVYGPNDLFPDLDLKTDDEGSVSFRQYFGVTNVKSGTRNQRGFKGTLKELVTKNGSGIYLVIACRPSERHSLAGAVGASRYNLYNTVQGRHMPPIGSHFPLNVAAQAIERNQARVATRKRSRSSPARAAPTRTYANVVAGRGKNSPARPRSVKRVNTGVRSRAAALFVKAKNNAPKNIREAALIKSINNQEKKLRENMEKVEKARQAERAKAPPKPVKPNSNSNNNLYR